jgi:hypothetical protein
MHGTNFSPPAFVAFDPKVSINQKQQGSRSMAILVAVLTVILVTKIVAPIFSRLGVGLGAALFFLAHLD